MSDHDPFGDYEPAPTPTLEEDRPPRPRDRRRESTPDMFLNALALLFVSLAIAVCLFAILLWQDPDLPFNPFPPATVTPTASMVAQDVATVGPTILVVTATPLPSETPSPTATATPRPTATRAAVPSDATNTPSSYPFTMQNEAPTYTAYTGEAGCDYMAIAGQVFDVNGDPLMGMPILVEGDDRFSALGFSGNAPSYGRSGYEVFINDIPYEGVFTVRLIGENGQPRSADIVVETSDSCEQNLVIVNFVANQPLD